MMPEPLAVVIDRTPHPWLLPNQKKAERTRRPYKQAIRDTAAIATINALDGKTWSWAGPIVLHIDIFWEPGRRRADWDNAIAAMKGAIDGVFSRIDADDRQVTGVFLQQGRDNLRDGYTVILIEPMETTQ